ncbi:MAG: hypothetical protein IT479_00520 [Xanthomonadales bacterium]|nr:hypothetical protein [Xanthomonadales bacterium]MCC6591736.1 hypothetical protein [Xanthomonadales bacterium]MCE7929757.1 hypothetical protein [Xanthomonadales bacterium PRO6]
MRKLLAVLLLCGSTVASAEGLSCQDIDEMGEALTGLGIALEDENAQIGEGSPEHQALADISVGLAQIADAYEDEEFGASAVKMAEAWGNNDRDAFTDGLAEVVAQLAVVHTEHCQ